MDNKEKVQEAIRQTESKISQLGIELANLKAELDKPSRVEVASDGAVLEAKRIGWYYITGLSITVTGPDDIKYLTTFATKEQAQDELLRREISCYIRRRACELNDNHDWRKVFDKNQYRILIERSCSKPTPIFCVDYNLSFFHFCAYFSKKEHAQTVAGELNAKYSPETIKRLYYAEEK